MMDSDGAVIDEQQEEIDRLRHERGVVIEQRDSIIKVLEDAGLWEMVKATVEARAAKPRMIGVLTNITG